MELELKPIPGYEGLYSASDTGRIMSHVSRKFLSDTPRPDGYCQVCLFLGRSRRNYYVHRLVLAAFEDYDLSSDTPVDHIDGLKSNNRLSNLRAVSQTENELHKHGRLGTESEGHRICTKCRKLKPFAEFYKSNSILTCWCRGCITVYGIEKRSK